MFGGHERVDDAHEAIKAEFLGNSEPPLAVNDRTSLVAPIRRNLEGFQHAVTADRCPQELVLGPQYALGAIGVEVDASDWE